MKKRFIKIAIVVSFIAMMIVFFFSCEFLLSISGQKTIVQRINEELDPSESCDDCDESNADSTSDDDSQTINKGQKSSDNFSFAEIDNMEFCLIDVISAARSSL